MEIILLIILMFLLFIFCNLILIKRFKDQTKDFVREVKNSLVLKIIVIIKFVSKLLKMMSKS